MEDPMAKKTAKAAAKPAKIAPSKKQRTKSEIYTVIAEHNGISRKQVAGVFDTLGSLIAADLAKGGGVFAVPGMMKIFVKHKPATKAGMKPNPFKPGEMMEVKAKPASKVVKVRPMKGLKAMVA
jgi:nucleoid DNA-binding protein